LADPNWNVVAICNDSGNVLERYNYDAFGKRNVFDTDFMAKTGTNFDWDRTFTGQVLDSETGLILYRKRYLSIKLGRFISCDPVGYESDACNLYRYVQNKPIRFTDPEGKDWLDGMNACTKDNDPVDAALAKILALLTAQPIPKSWVAALADGVGDTQLARTIRGTMRNRGVSSVTNIPSSLSAKLRAGGRSSLRLLGRVASGIAGPVLVAYGLALAGVETHCLGVCCTASLYGINYDPNSMSMDNAWNF
jgi:RHS repeat-associated protein